MGEDTRTLTLFSCEAATVAPGLAYHGPRFWKAVAPISTRRDGFAFLRVGIVQSALAEDVE